MKFHTPQDWTIDKVPDKARPEFWHNKPLPKEHLPATFHFLRSISLIDGKYTVPENCTHIEVFRDDEFELIFYQQEAERINPNYDTEMQQWVECNKFAVDHARDVYKEWAEWRQEEIDKIEQEKEDAERKMLIKKKKKYGQPE